jgi:hypothetical protein
MTDRKALEEIKKVFEKHPQLDFQDQTKILQIVMNALKEPEPLLFRKDWPI